MICLYILNFKFFWLLLFSRRQVISVIVLMVLIKEQRFGENSVEVLSASFSHVVGRFSSEEPFCRDRRVSPNEPGYGIGTIKRELFHL